MAMGRPRKTRTDLPDGLHFRADRGTYYYRPTRGGSGHISNLAASPAKKRSENG